MLSILDYHKTTTVYFQQHTHIWNFFAGHQHKEEQLKDYKTELLKNTYKFDATVEASLYEKVNAAKEKLCLSLPVTLYQAQHTEEMNATIAYLTNEAHIVFSGRLLQSLTDAEMQAIIAHELSHIQLYTQLNGGVEIADRIVTAIANHVESTPAHYETARLFKLYTEIFCDRGAYTVTGDYSPIVSSLVKLSTGLQTVNADSYIKQAEEIFSANASTKTTGVSHPENFIRARAIWLWHTKGNAAEATIKQMIEGHTNIEELDLFQQQYISGITKQIIALVLQRAWMQTTHTVALGKQYFSNLSITTELQDTSNLRSRIENMHSNIHDYLAYVLYDFATTDKTLEDIPLGYCFYLADELKLDKAFATAVKKEQKLSDKKVIALKKQTLAAYQQQEMQPA